MTLDLWFILMFAAALIAAIFTKSLLMNLGVTILCILGISLTRNLEANGTVVQGLIVMFILVIVYCLIQMLWRVERI